MALAFQNMLERFGLTEKILVVNTDNTTLNDKQTTKLDALDNSFEEANRVHCFNHTLQLSAKALLTPFNTAILGKATQADQMPEEDDDNQLIPEDGEDDNDNDDKDVEEEEEDKNDEDNSIDKLQELSENERTWILESTATVCETVTKVCAREAGC